MLAMDMTYMDDLLIEYVSFLVDEEGTIENVILYHNIIFEFPDEEPEVLNKLDRPLSSLIEEEISKKTDSLKNKVNCEIIVEEKSDTAEGLKALQKKQQADLIVFGKKVTYDGSGYLIERVMSNHTDAHLLVFPETAKHRLQKFLVPVDFSKKSASVLRYAVDWANRRHAQLKCQHVFAVPKIYFPYVPVRDLKEETSEQAQRQWIRFKKRYFPEEELEITFSFHSDRSVAQLVYDHALHSQSDLIMVPTETGITPSTVIQLLKVDINVPLMIVHQ